MTKKNYNASEWRKRVSRMVDLGAVFYFVPAGNGYDYDRFFVVYQIPGEFRVMSSFGYITGLSGGGFVRVGIDKNGVVERFEKETFINNKTGRQIMTINSRNLGHIFSNEL